MQLKLSSGGHIHQTVTHATQEKNVVPPDDAKLEAWLGAIKIAGFCISLSLLVLIPLLFLNPTMAAPTIMQWVDQYPALAFAMILVMTLSIMPVINEMYPEGHRKRINFKGILAMAVNAFRTLTGTRRYQTTDIWHQTRREIPTSFTIDLDAPQGATFTWTKHHEQATVLHEELCSDPGHRSQTIPTEPEAHSVALKPGSIALELVQVPDMGVCLEVRDTQGGQRLVFTLDTQDHDIQPDNLPIKAQDAVRLDATSQRRLLDTLLNHCRMANIPIPRALRHVAVHTQAVATATVSG